MRALITGLTLATLVLAGCGPDEAVTDGADAQGAVGAEEQSDTDGAAADTRPGDDRDAADDPGSDTNEYVTVSIDDFLFDADAITIEVGDTVTWTHDGRITHDVTARDGSFASDNLGAGDSFTHTFTDAGEFAYVCTLHSQMVATVTVG